MREQRVTPHRKRFARAKHRCSLSRATRGTRVLRPHFIMRQRIPADGLHATTIVAGQSGTLACSRKNVTKRRSDGAKKSVDYEFSFDLLMVETGE